MCRTPRQLLTDREGTLPWRRSHVRLLVIAFAVGAVLDAGLVVWALRA